MRANSSSCAASCRSASSRSGRAAPLCDDLPGLPGCSGAPARELALRQEAAQEELFARLRSTPGP